MSAQPAESCQVPSKLSVKAHYICEAKSMAACVGPLCSTSLVLPTLKLLNWGIWVLKTVHLQGKLPFFQSVAHRKAFTSFAAGL